jgi:beta-glucosidase
MKHFSMVLVVLFGLQGAVIAQSGAPHSSGASQVPIYKDPHADVEARIADLMGHMSIDDKAQLLHPLFFGTRPNPRLGIPALKFIDGSYGVRCGESTSFCALVNHAATWDPDLISRVGVALAEEIKSKGRNMLLGPVIYMHRIPQGGRNAESYSEDPFLAGTIVSSYIEAIQSQKIATTACFLAAKTQEYHVTAYDARVDERTLNEIYLPAFRMAVEDAKVWGIMTPYNHINGVRAANDAYLLWDTLKGKWHFPGLVMTDWAGVQNFQESIFAGLDLDMPEGHAYTVDKLSEVYRKAKGEHVDPDEALECKLLSSRLDESVRRILRVMFTNGLFDGNPVPTPFDLAAHRKLSADVARESITLLKNERGLLPLDRKKIQSLAIIGPNANVCRHSILSASRVLPYVTVTPLEGITSKVGKEIALHYSQGCDIDDEGSLLTDQTVTTPDGRKGFLAEFFDGLEPNGKPAMTKIEPSLGYMWLTNPIHPEVPGDYSIRVRGLWTPLESGYYRLFATGGELTVRNAGSQNASLDAKATCAESKQFGGKQYCFYHKGTTYALNAIFKRYEWNDFEIRYQYREDHAQENATEAARQSDVALLFLGFSETLEGEGHDRSPNLPEDQLALLRSVLAVNRNIVVILNSGSGLSMDPWSHDVPAIVEAYYPGQEEGTAIADILFGDVNPSGKLPFTCMKRWEDSPVYSHYPEGADEVLPYVEGIYVGYRYFDRPDAPQAAFPFGHGLSYTTFTYSNLSISPRATQTGEVSATVQVRNSGGRAGAEVVQLYIGADHSSVDRPVKELKGYRKVFLGAGESTTVQFTIHRNDLEFYDTLSHDWKAEPGTFTVYIGSSSRDIRQVGKFALTF